MDVLARRKYLIWWLIRYSARGLSSVDPIPVAIALDDLDKVLWLLDWQSSSPPTHVA